MRRTMMLLLVLLALAPTIGAGAQERDSTAHAEADARSLPPETARELAALYNEPAALRADGRLDIAADQVVEGNVAAINGPVHIAGRVTGRVLAINGDVLLEPGARIDGDLIVVGGAVEGRERATIGGDVRIHRQVLYFTRDGDRIVADTRPADDSFWARWERRRRPRSVSKLTLASGGTYNRVEGLAIYVGPAFRRPTPWGSVSVRAYGIVRTADDFDWDSENLGHRASAEVRYGREEGLALGGVLYDEVAAVEDWQLSDVEVGLASFLLHRDYRDYYNRHGGRVYLSAFRGETADLTVSLADERWGRRDERDPFTLFRNDDAWRENPLVDEGPFHVLNATARVDTRNDVRDPWSGWYVVADVERGSGVVTRAAVGPIQNPVGPGPAEYVRGFLDVRRYNRISPEGSLNMRLVLGGWLGGDRLPLQRRFSVNGPGALPGFDFRQIDDGADVGFCGVAPTAPGLPAQCERMALAQIEYRGDLHLGFDFGESETGWRAKFDRAGQWVAFADAGRGWLVGPRSGRLQYPADDFPSLGTFRTDVGLGLDFGIVGAYVAKSVSDADEPANFFLRLRHRF